MVSFPNWHRYLYALLAALLAASIAMATGAVQVPPGLHDVAPYAGLVEVFLASLLPYIGDTTGPQAPRG